MKVINSPDFPQMFKTHLNRHLEDIGSTTHTLEVSSKILNLTVNDMLTLGQIESSKFRIYSSVFDIRSVVSEIMSL